MIVVCCVVSTGGLLFDSFVSGFGSYTTTEQLKAHARDVQDAQGGQDDDDEVLQVTHALETDIMERERGTFHGWVLISCASVASKSRSQCFYTTFAAKYHGLSNYGIEMLSHHGYTMCLTSFQTMTETMVLESRESTRYMYIS
jgi:seryl-tRNA synthetase